MKTICFDTSVMVAAMVKAHPKHNLAFPWFKRAKAKEFTLMLSNHSLAELFAVLTAMPLSPKISPGMAQRLIGDNIESVAKIVNLSLSDYKSAMKRMVDLNLSGAVMYDALIVTAAQKAKVDQILTFNVKDFVRILPENEEFIISP